MLYNGALDEVSNILIEDCLVCLKTEKQNKTIVRPPDKNTYLKINFLIFQPKHVVGTQKNRLNEMVLLSSHNTCLN